MRYQTYKTDGYLQHPDHHGKLYSLWDSTVYFGPLWGFPDSPEIHASDRFYQAHTLAQGGGLNYIEARDQKWLVEYGRDAFFFPAAAAAQYHFAYGDPGRARRHVDWMLANSNVYGLFPERILRDRSDCSESSPLSWCCAEFAAAVLAWR
jgi:GH15 family glucan-1,4-alpha-glucosidase